MKIIAWRKKSVFKDYDLKNVTHKRKNLEPDKNTFYYSKGAFVIDLISIKNEAFFSAPFF